MLDMQIIDDTCRQRERGEDLYRRVFEEHNKPVVRKERVQSTHLPLLNPWTVPSERRDEAEQFEMLRVGEMNALQERELRHWLDAFRPAQELRNYMAHRHDAPPIEPKGDVKFFVRTMDAWGFTRAQAGAVLGLRDAVLASEVFKGALGVPAGELDERLTIVTRLILDLDGMYEDDAVIKSWLDLRRTELGSKSPRELLASGRLEGLFKVRSLIRYEARR